MRTPRRVCAAAICATVLVPIIGSVASAGPAPDHFSIDDVTVTEGDAGTTNAVITLRRTDASNGTAWVDYATQNVTAAAPGDYSSVGGTAKFLGNRREVTITVPINGDATAEGDETFNVVLSNPQKVGVIDDTTGVVTIVDDDGVTPSVVFADQAVVEGDPTGPDPAVGEARRTSFTAEISAPSLLPVSFTVEPANAGVCASSPSPAQLFYDFALPGSPLRVTIPAGHTRVQVPFDVWADTVVEPDEDLFFRFSNFENAVFVPENCNTQKVTIRNDDLPPPSLVFVDQSDVEGNPSASSNGEARNASFTVRISAPSTRVVSFTVAPATSGVCTTTPNPAQPLMDYGFPSTTSYDITIPPGQTTATVPFQLWADRSVEADEDFFVGFSNLQNVTVVAENCNVQKFTIRNDD